MRSLVKLIVVAGVIGKLGVEGVVVRAAVTPAPRAEDVRFMAKRQDPDAVSLVEVLLTAVPTSIRQIIATNIPQASSIIKEEFQHGQIPEWFSELPEEIQSYLIGRFGPKTAFPTDPPASLSGSASATARPTDTTLTTETSRASSSDASQPDPPTPTGSSGSIPLFGWPTPTTATDSTASASTPSALTTSTAPMASTDPSSASSTSRSSSSHSISASSSTRPSSSLIPEAPPSTSSGLTKGQKIGIGLGVPLGLLAAGALIFGCCTFLRRRHKKHVDGSIPPSSPGFIPRFAFHERSADSLEHRTSLIGDANRSTHNLAPTPWDEEGVDPADPAPVHNAYTAHDDAAMMAADASPVPDAGMAMHDPQPIMAPALFHTHSSNRARGKRTSYTSLHSVAEVSEPDEAESPVLGRHASPKLSPGRSLIPTPPILAAAQIKRKPVPSSPPLAPTSLTAPTASPRPLRQPMPEQSGSSSSGLTLSTSSGFNTSSSSGLGFNNTSSSSGLAVHTEATSPVSPVSNRTPSNPFSYDTYVEDYGPEYHAGYVDVDDGLYGGNTSLSRYPEPRRKSSKPEWPLRNLVGSSGHRRKNSPIWDRIYEE